jgi:hypothetical protein
MYSRVNSPSLPPSWSPLSALREQLLANCNALAMRRPGLADLLRKFTSSRNYQVLPGNDQVQLGLHTDQGIQPLPHPLPPAAARQIAAKLCPTGTYATPVLVTGEDLGWLWTSLYQLPAQVPQAPGHRPPMFCLVRDMERLWLMLHIQDWTKFLADERVRLFVGADSFQQFKNSLIEDSAVPWPRASVVIDPTLMPAGTTIDSIVQESGAALNRKFAALQTQLSAQHAAQSAATLADLYSSGRPLKVLGITSRYTTFLQYSMRDWLAAFERLGHQTKLVIESADHEMTGAVAFAQASADFTPDLVVVIDHFRKELGGLPENVPVAMWVQDKLPNLFTPGAGQAQGSRDYSLGFGRLRMIREFSYPASRYMSAVVGLDEDRFSPRELSASEIERFGADVTFVSHASATAEQILSEEIKRIGSADAGRLLSNVFEQMRAVYEAGGAVTEPIEIRRLIDRASADTHVSFPTAQMQPLIDLFLLRVNNALFRHQTLKWVAETGVDLRIWGRGWETHPTLGRFARGVAENDSQLPIIYQASKINLQATPHGAVHQRLMEGLASGGFFLIRYLPGDQVEPEFAKIWEWCREADIRSDEELKRNCPPDIHAAIARIAVLQKQDPFEAGRFIDQLEASADDGYIRSADSVWRNDYPSVCFRSKAELTAKVTHFLKNADERRERAESMRRVVLDRFTYTATTKRLLKFMADDLVRQAAGRSVAAA